MQKDARMCLQRAAECARLAEDEKQPELRQHFTKLAASWMKVASETVEITSTSTSQSRWP
jgi:hypothetical protein